MKSNNRLLRGWSWLAVCLLLLAIPAHAGGPLNADPGTGEAFVWDVTQPVPFNPDQGGLGILPFGWDNDTAVVKTEEAFQRWGDVTTAAVTYANAGQMAFDVDINNFFTLLDFGSFGPPGEAPDGLSPIVFDEDGSIFSVLFGPGSGVIGFATPNVFDVDNHLNVEGICFLNGEFLDGNPGNNEFEDPEQMFGTMVHEFGHYSGLAHTVVNGQALILGEDTGFGVPTPEVVEIMYPFSIDGQGTTPLADDIAILSALYPEPGFFDITGTISGHVFLEDSETLANGVNVIARNHLDPFLDAVSAITGDFIHGFPGGNAAFQGLYTIRGLVDKGEYRIEIDRILLGGFSTRPIFPFPGPEEFYNGTDESANPGTDDPSDFTLVLSDDGEPVLDIDIIFNSLVGDPLPVTDAVIFSPLGVTSAQTLVERAAKERGLTITLDEARAALQAKARSLDEIEAALNELGVTNQRSATLPANLADFNYLFVVLGQFPANFVVPASSGGALAIETYIAGGGKVYMEGGDVWFFDPLVGGHNFSPLFGIEAFEDGAPGGELQVIVGSAFAEGQDFIHNPGTDNFPDHIGPLEQAFVVHSNNFPAFDVGVANPFGVADLGNGRTIGTSFVFGQLLEEGATATRAELMANYLNFFDNGFAFEEGRQLRVRPDAIDFGPALIGIPGQPVDIKVENIGTETVTISDISAADGEFSVSGLPAFPVEILSGASIIFQAQFTPSDVAPVTGAVAIASDDEDEPVLEVALSGEGVPPPRPGTLFASTGNDNTLITVEPGSGAGTAIGSTAGLGSMTEIEFREDGVLFGSTGGGSSNIVRIDLASGAPTLVGPHEFGAVNGLEFADDGTLFGTHITGPGAPSQLVTVNTETGELTFIGPTGFSNIGGLAFAPDGTLYGGTSGPAGGTLVTIDPATGAGELVGPVGFSDIAALEFGPDGVLYGGLGGGGGNPFAGSLVTIDPASGEGTLVGESGFRVLSGLAFFPGELPCPGILVEPSLLTFRVQQGETDSGILTISNATSGDCELDLEWSLTEEEVTLLAADGSEIPVSLRKRVKAAEAGQFGALYKLIQTSDSPYGVMRPEERLVSRSEKTAITTQACPWLSADPTSGVLAPLTSQEVEIIVDASALQPGEFRCNLIIDSNDPETPQATVPVLLRVSGPTFCENGSFETGDFSSWTTQDMSSPFFPLSVEGAGITPGFGFFSSEPTDGDFAAIHGFDGDGPGTIRIAQDVTVPPSALFLEFDYRAAWDLLTFGATQDRTFEVNIEPAGGGTPLHTELILTAVSGTQEMDTGPQTGVVDMSPFAGQDVRISFDWHIPETFSGPGFFQLDNVICNFISSPPVVATVNCPMIPEGCPFDVEVTVDMSGSPPPDDLLGSFSSILTWDPDRLDFVGAELGSDFGGVINDENAATGELRFNGAKAEGAGGNVVILVATFQPHGLQGDAGGIELDFSAMAAAVTFRDLLPGLIIHGCDFVIGEPLLLGDINGDGVVNSTDALICLSFDIGLPLPPEFEELINAGLGDVNQDGETNATDCLIMLSFDAGMEVPFPVGEPACPITSNGQPLASRILPKVGANGTNLILASAVPEGGQIPPATTIEVPVMVDITLLEEDLGSYSATLAWNPAVLTFLGYSGGSGTGFDHPMVNVSEAGEGKLSFASANPAGANGAVNLLNVQFKVVGETGASSALSLEFRSLAASRTFADLLPLLTLDSENLQVAAIPTTYALGQNYPNPFNPETTINYELPEGGLVRIMVYNLLGQRVRTLFDETQPAGTYAIKWDGKNNDGQIVPSGVYILRMKSGDFVADRKMVLLK
ncbi:MAG: FlgD immunoglobulin-like domain containing protein [bacterium]